MDTDKNLLLESAIRNSSVEQWKKEGKQIMGTICCHVPEEIIHAAGLLPVRIRATGCADDSEGEVWMSSFACSYARSCLEFFLNGTYDFLDGVVNSDGCSMASRILDNMKYTDKGKGLFLREFGAPRLVDDKHTLPYYRSELEELKEAIEKRFGVTITDEKLKASVALYNETRALIRELYELRKSEDQVITGADSLKLILAAMSMPKEEYNKLLRKYLDELKKKTPLTGHRARLMLIGSALDDPEYIKVIEDQGCLIVTDLNCYGNRYLWEPVTLEGGDTMASLAKSYLSRPVCPRMCELSIHDELYDLLIGMVKDFKVDGIVFSKMKNCQLWGSESVYIEDKLKEAKIPALTVEREEIMTNAGQLAVRVEAFIEMIQGEVQ